jgi:hypothetical protein
MYSGQYNATIIGVINPGGPRSAVWLIFYKEKLTTSIVYPYRDYVYGFVILIFVGTVISGFSFMSSNRKLPRRERAKKR